MGGEWNVIAAAHRARETARQPAMVGEGRKQAGRDRVGRPAYRVDVHLVMVRSGRVVRDHIQFDHPQDVIARMRRGKRVAAHHALLLPVEGYEQDRRIERIRRQSMCRRQNTRHAARVVIRAGRRCRIVVRPDDVVVRGMHRAGQQPHYVVVGRTAVREWVQRSGQAIGQELAQNVVARRVMLGSSETAIVPVAGIQAVQVAAVTGLRDLIDNRHDRICLKLRRARECDDARHQYRSKAAHIQTHYSEALDALKLPEVVKRMESIGQSHRRRYLPHIPGSQVGPASVHRPSKRVFPWACRRSAQGFARK